MSIKTRITQLERIVQQRLTPAVGVIDLPKLVALFERLASRLSNDGHTEMSLRAEKLVRALSSDDPAVRANTLQALKQVAREAEERLRA